MVELRDVHMRFEEKKVLDGVSLKVESRERLVIMGQSGSGKSTILRLILGTLRPDFGSIFSSNLKSRACPGGSFNGCDSTSVWCFSIQHC